MYEVTVTRTFAAAHAIRLYDGQIEPLHGHNWHVQVTVGAERLDRIELAMDFHALERLVDGIVAQATNRHLNQIAPFADGRGGLAVNPTAERVAWWIGTQVAQGLPARARLVSVQVGEAPGCTATYRL